MTAQSTIASRYELDARGRVNPDYKSPEQTYGDALNFSAETTDDDRLIQDADATKTQADPTNESSASSKRGKRSLNDRLRGFVRQMNNSTYIYPTVTILIMTLVVIIAIFQQSVSLIIKVILILLLMAFLFYTIWQFRSKNIAT